jgi:hypothetical protein
MELRLLVPTREVKTGVLRIMLPLMIGLRKGRLMADKFPATGCRPPFVMVVNFGKDSDVKLVVGFSADIELTPTSSLRSFLEIWITIQYSVDTNTVLRGVQIILVCNSDRWVRPSGI